MTPIKDISDVRRIPRLGKIRLGIKITEPKKNPYPHPTDYFVVPDEIKAYLREEKPKVLEIMFPVDDPLLFAPQFLKCYSMTQGLVCRGDGTNCLRKVDTETGDIACHTTKEWEFKKMTCDPSACPEAVGDPERGTRPQCRRVMNLLFVMPSVPGLGVWQLDTSSFNSIVNINSFIDIMKRAGVRIAWIPLKLSLEPTDVSPPGITKKTVHVLHLRSDLKLGELLQLSAKPPARALLPAVDEEEAPGDLYPPEVLAEAEAAKQPPTAPSKEEAPPPPPEEEKTPDDVVEDDVPDYNALFRICFQFWKNKDGKPMQPIDVARELGYGNTMDLFSLKQTAWQSFQAIKAAKMPQDAKGQ